MKHPTNITLLLLGLFLLSQLIGLLVLSQYLQTGQDLPLGLAMPDISGEEALAFMLVSIAISTIVILLLIRFNLTLLIKAWMFLGVVMLLTVSLSALMTPLYAFVLAVLFGVFKVFKFNVYLHNISELFIYGGLAVLFSPILNIPSAIGLLIIISVYDMIAVWKSKHMVYMAKGIMATKYFPGISVPYNNSQPKVSDKMDKTIDAVSEKRERSMGAILGGGDMAFPLIFSGVVLQGLLLSHSLLESLFLTAIIPIFATLALATLFAISEKKKFYPAMPFVAVGCLIGYFIITLI